MKLFMSYSRRLNKIILTGLIAVLPIAATFYLLVWLMTAAEDVLGGLLKFSLPGGWYWPGMGVAAGVVMIFLVGLVKENFFARKTAGGLSRSGWCELVCCLLK